MLQGQSAVKTHGIREELNKRFSPFERCLMICVLEEAINKLVILGGTKGQYASNCNFQSANIRFSNKHVNVVYDLFSHLVIPTSAHKLREIKFQRERELVAKVLSLIRAELTELGEIHSLYAFISMDTHCRLENMNIVERHGKNISRLEEMKSLSEKIRQETAHTAINQEVEIEKKKKELEIFKSLAITQMIYNYRWQSARYDQNTVLIERRYRKTQEEMDRLDNETSFEDRVHKETLKYLAIATKQVEEDVVYWNELYRKDIGKMEMNIMNLEGNIEDATTQLELTLESTETEKELMKELKEEKEERDARLAIEELQEECAIKIQAWWRGTMVRWEFGKYAEIMKKKFKKQKKMKK